MTHRETLKSIKTIKSPMFFSNYDEKTSSPSDNTDADDPSSPRIGAKSTMLNLADVIINEKNSEKDYLENDNIQRVNPAARNAQIRSTNYKRPL